MSEAMSDAMSNLRDHAPSLPSAKDAKDAVLSHVPSLKDVDASALRDKLPQAKGKKKTSVIAVVLGLFMLGGAAFAILRRSTPDAPVSPTIYTPPLPKP